MTEDFRDNMIFARIMILGTQSGYMSTLIFYSAIVIFQGWLPTTCP
jgi:hypothetical protein